ncbi:MAG TPA: RidA family protein [Terriglobia bacterium]|nr:RidA family protein [Terriglobia bacterium]
MLPTRSTRRKFGTALASFVSGLGITSASAKALAAGNPQAKSVEKLGDDGKPGKTASFIMPIVRHNGLIYVAGQGAHDDRPREQWDIGAHTQTVLDKVKNLVEHGGSTMDDVVQLSVFLAKIEDYEGMNKVFKSYFPNGGPARTTVAVAALPGNSLVEINCIAAVTR